MTTDQNKATFLKDIELPGEGAIEVNTGESNDNVFLIKYTSYISPGVFLSLNLDSLELTQFFSDKAMINATGYN